MAKNSQMTRDMYIRGVRDLLMSVNGTKEEPMGHWVVLVVTREVIQAWWANPKLLTPVLLGLWRGGAPFEPKSGEGPVSG